MGPRKIKAVTKLLQSSTNPYPIDYQSDTLTINKSDKDLQPQPLIFQ